MLELMNNDLFKNILLYKEHILYNKNLPIKNKKLYKDIDKNYIHDNIVHIDDLKAHVETIENYHDTILSIKNNIEKALQQGEEIYPIYKIFQNKEQINFKNGRPTKSLPSLLEATMYKNDISYFTKTILQIAEELEQQIVEKNHPYPYKKIQKNLQISAKDLKDILELIGGYIIEETYNSKDELIKTIIKQDKDYSYLLSDNKILPKTTDEKNILSFKKVFEQNNKGKFLMVLDNIEDLEKEQNKINLYDKNLKFYIHYNE